MRIFLIAALFFTAAGCREVSFPVPQQRSMPEFRLRQILEIRPESDGFAATAQNSSIIGGVLPVAPGLDWSWTTAHPAFRFKLDQPSGWDLDIKLTTADVVFDKIGPQQLTVFVNGTKTGSATLDQCRTWLLRFPVAPALLPDPAETRVTLAIAPCLPQPEGPPLCILLHNVGFTRPLTAQDPGR